jgi:GNAT superfamily N-acetyltransferase
MEIYIRKALSRDLQAIHGLVAELAEYEKAPNEFIASLEEYQLDFQAGIFDAIVSEVEGTVVGMALYYMAYSTWKGKMLYLEDFVVQAPYRRYGIGQMLFDQFLTEAQTQGCRLVKWQVLDWNTPAVKFYEKNGAIIEKEWWTGKLFFTTKI